MKREQFDDTENEVHTVVTFSPKVAMKVSLSALVAVVVQVVAVIVLVVRMQADVEHLKDSMREVVSKIDRYDTNGSQAHQLLKQRVDGIDGHIDSISKLTADNARMSGDLQRQITETGSQLRAVIDLISPHNPVGKRSSVRDRPAN